MTGLSAALDPEHDSDTLLANLHHAVPDVKGPRRPQKRRGPSACRPPAHQASDRSTAGHGPALARSRVTPRDRRSWLPAVRRQGRREEDEDEENRDQEHRGGPRQDGGQAAWVGFHGSQTRRRDIVLRGF